jgi:hypothetical protein
MSIKIVLLGVQLVRVILPINIFLGLLGNSLNIIVPTRPTLYNSGSNHHFLALGINNLLGSSLF